MSETGPRYQNIHPTELEYFERRDIREPAVEELKEAIEARGYDDGRPMKVVPNGKGYLVADGNHRLRAVEDKGLDREVPCLVYEDGDAVEIGLESNRGEDVYAEEDLFDTLDTIEYLQEEGLTQDEIADVLDDGFESWSGSKVKNHARLLREIRTEVLDLARSQQKGRVRSERTNVRFDFTEGWFRTSGLYELDTEWNEKHAQMRFMEWFVSDQNCDVSKGKIERKVEGLVRIQDHLETLEQDLLPSVEDEKRDDLHEKVVAGEFTEDSLAEAIRKANEGAQDKALFGVEALDGLEQIEDNSISTVITDPPYGVDFSSHRDTDNAEFGEGESVFAYLDQVFEKLTEVCKDNAHIYLFFAANNYCKLREIAEKHFDVTGTPLVWVKNNHVPTQDTKNGFKRMYAHKYEPILVCRMPNGDARELAGDISPNVLEYARPEGNARWHDAQKPRGLLRELVENSADPDETVLDPFAGSGSTMLAAKETGRHYVGIEKSDSYESRFKRELSEVK